MVFLILFAYILKVTLIIAISKRRRYELSTEALFYFLLIPLTQSFSMIFTMVKATVYNNVGSLLTWLVLRLAYIIADLAVYKAILIISKRKQTEQQNEFYARQLEMQLEHYKSFSGYAEELRHMRHDFANQTTVIKHLIASGQYDDAGKLLDETYENMRHLKAISFSDNKIINALVFNKYQTAQKSGISFNASLAIPAKIPNSIEISDMCRIMSNMLDNAIDACEAGNTEEVSTDNATELFIELNAMIMGGYLILHCKNPILHPLKLDRNNRPVTQKTTPGHGNGLNILDELATKYNGKVHISTKENVFDIKVSMHINTEN